MLLNPRLKEEQTQYSYNQPIIHIEDRSLDRNEHKLINEIKEKLSMLESA
jgi:hypothetical protein